MIRNMLSIIRCLLIILFMSEYAFAYNKWITIRPPGEPRWVNWQERIVNVHLTNMTAEILIDVVLKIRESKTVQEKYKHRITYELGTIAAGIQETFAHMLEIYRTYSDLPSYVANQGNLYEVLDAYHIIQGDYNQIRLERDLFYKTLEKHDKIRAEKDKRISSLSGGGGVKGPYQDALLAGEIPQGRRYMMSTTMEPVDMKNMSLNDVEPVRWEDFIDDKDDAPSVTETVQPPQIKVRTSLGTSKKPAVKRIWRRGGMVH